MSFKVHKNPSGRMFIEGLDQGGSPFQVADGWREDGEPLLRIGVMGLPARLTRSQVAEILPHLQRFAITGRMAEEISQ